MNLVLVTKSQPGLTLQKQAVTCVFHLEHSVKENFKDCLSHIQALGYDLCSNPSESS